MCTRGERAGAGNCRRETGGGWTCTEAHVGVEAASQGGGMRGGRAVKGGGERREVAVLSMGGLQLEPLLWRRGAEGFLAADGDPTEGRRLAAALGYVAHCLVALEQYLDVPLRYPIHAAASHSVVFDYSPPAGTYRSGRPPNEPQENRNQPSRIKCCHASLVLSCPYHPLLPIFTQCP